MNVLAIGVHMDDCEYAAGGTIKLLAEKGANVTLLNIIPYKDNNGRNEEADAQSVRAAEILGAKKITLEYDECKFYKNNEKTVRMTEQVICETKPDIIFIMHPKDNHIEHVECALTCKDAIFAAAVSGVSPNEVYTYETGPRQSMCYFVPDVYIDVSSAKETLKESMYAFGSDNASGAWLWKEKEICARFRAHESFGGSGATLAEGFCILKYPKGNNDFLLRSFLQDFFRWGGTPMYHQNADMFFYSK